MFTEAALFDFTHTTCRASQEAREIESHKRMLAAFFKEQVSMKSHKLYSEQQMEYSELALRLFNTRCLKHQRMFNMQEGNPALAPFSAEDHEALNQSRRVLEPIQMKDWFPEYGCVMLRSECIGHFRISLLGLDGWQFANHT